MDATLKVKPILQRMQHKADYWYEQSGVIPYRLNTSTTATNYDSSQFEVLLITSRKRKRWVIPKGIIEPSLTPQESAAKEALEEAGIKGRISGTSIGVYTYDKWGGTCRVEVFPFKVETVFNDWLEAGMRDREWLSVEEAANRVREDGLKDIFRRLPEVVLRLC